jgi:hypothetical protein
MDNDVTSIDTKLFKYTLVIHSKEWEKRHVDDRNNCFDIMKFIKYLLQQLNIKISKTKHKVLTMEIENYIMMNLYLINKIIQNYTFYLYKDPELIEIFNWLEVFKTWPCPISNFCNRVIENIINENSFQGISLFNKLRQDYYLDLMDNDITSIDTKHFKYTLVIHSKEWEKRHVDDMNN